MPRSTPSGRRRSNAAVPSAGGDGNNSCSAPGTQRVTLPPPPLPEEAFVGRVTRGHRTSTDGHRCHPFPFRVAVYSGADDHKGPGGPRHFETNRDGDGIFNAFETPLTHSSSITPAC